MDLNDDKILELYYRETGTHEQQEVARDRIHWVLEQVRGERALDIGCSNGLVPLLLGRAGVGVVGIDLRPDAVEEARRHLVAEPEGVRERVSFRCAEVEAMGAPEVPFDTVVLGEVLEHLTRPEEALASVARQLAADGRVVITVPFGLHPDPDHKRSFYLDDFVALVASVFGVVELAVVDGYIRCVARAGLDARPSAERLLELSSVAFAEREARARRELLYLRGMYHALKVQHATSDQERRSREAELKSLRAESRARLDDEVTALEEAKARADAASAAAQRMSHRRAAEIARLRATPGRKLGGLLVDALASPLALGRVPSALAAMALESSARAASARKAERLRKRPLAQPAVAGTSGAAGAAAKPASRLFTAERTKLPLSVACILDEFSMENLRHDCTLTALTREGWKEALERERPDLLLVESAWFGNKGEWQYKITYSEPKDDNPLFALLAHCREEGIPTVFWNKEDPPNYDRFIDAARRFDHIFTTDADCVPRYERDAPDSTIGVLPFAAQPAVQNPVERRRFEHLGEACFAGAWYPGHPERHEDARILIDAARPYGVAIYDRYLNHPAHDRHKFPDEYTDLIRGSLSFDEMLEKYRQFSIFLNVNSVKGSPTMFSRRVLELLACGTPVVSGYAKGIEDLLGEEIVPMCRSAEEAKEVMHRVLSDRLLRDRLVLTGQRKIFSEHTYAARLRQIAGVVDLALPSARPHVTAITATIRKGHVDDMLRNFQRQSYPERDLLVVINEGKELDEAFIHERAKALGVENYRVIVAPESTTLGACLNLGVESARGEIFAKMDDDDYYGEHYLTDSVLALDYSGAECVGKETYFTYAAGRDKMYVRMPKREHRFCKFVIGTTLVARRSIYPRVRFGDRRVGEDTAFLNELADAGMRLYSHSRYGYIKYYAASTGHHTWKVEEAEYLNGRVAKFFARGFEPDRVCF